MTLSQWQLFKVTELAFSQLTDIMSFIPQYRQLDKTSEPVTLLLLRGVGAKLFEGMGAIDFQLRHLTK
jgi:hypothetical protein